MRIVCVIGTRPEAVKMAPVVRALRRAPWATARVITTGQHREILHQTLRLFDIRPDIDLNVMTTDQTLAGLTARVIQALDPVLESEGADLVLAQGDTTTVMVCALLCFYRKIAFGHVEAGLRTGDLQNPFPEEFNRVVAGRVAALHFAPTALARDNLLAEGIDPASIHVTGNTVIDALLDVASRDPRVPVDIDPEQRLILVTAHRRENFGAPMLGICEALRTLHQRFPDVTIVYPVHPNPNVRDVAMRELAGHARIKLIAPTDYDQLVALLKRSTLVLTDSGGLQEEAPALSKPVLVLRAATERPEAIACGVAAIVGTDPESIVAHATRLLTDSSAYAAMAKGASPYGDGHASARIVEIILSSPGRGTRSGSPPEAKAVRVHV